MHISSLAWVGFSASDVDGYRDFFVNTLGLHLMVETEEFVALQADNGDVVEVFRADRSSFAQLSNAPVPGLEVSDLETSATELLEAGVELIGPIHQGSKGRRWLHFRGPDGMVFELIEQQRTHENP